MKILTFWNSVPSKVRWVGLVWFALGIVGIFSAIFPLIDYLNTQATGVQEAVIEDDVVPLIIQLGLSLLIVLASWKFIRRQSWGRMLLEIATWLTLVNCIGFEVLWISLTIYHWDKYRETTRMLYPLLSSEWGAAIDILLNVLFGLVVIILNIIILRAIRSSVAHEYVKEINGGRLD